MKHLPLFLLVVLMLALAACEQAADPPAPEPAPSTEPTIGKDTTSSQHYEAVGVIVSFMAEKKFVNIAHETIPGFMNAMTMPFEVKDTTLLHGFHEGDSVTFHFTVADGIRAIEKRHVASGQ